MELFRNLFQPQGINLFQISKDLFETNQEKRRKKEEARRKQKEFERQAKEITEKLFVQPTREVIKKVGELPSPFKRGEGKIVKPAYERPGFERFLGPEKKPREAIPIKEFFGEDKAGKEARKRLGVAIEEGLGTTFGAYAPLGAGAPVVAKTVRQLVKSGTKMAGLLTGIQAGISGLKGEEQDPRTLATAGVIGFAFGTIRPSPLKGVPSTELGAARTRLSEYGFGLKDNPTALRSKFNNTVKSLHPDKGGDPVKFDQFIKDLKVVTSAEPPSGLDITGLRNWVSSLWRKEAKTGKEIVPVKTPSAQLEPKPIAQQPIGKIPTTLIRLANEPNKTTFATRGGTWVSDEKGLNAIKGAEGIAGQTEYKFNVSVKKPLVIEDAILEDGSFSIINSGYESFIPKKYVDIGNSLYGKINVGEALSENQVDIELMNALYDAGIEYNTAKTVLNESQANKFDASMDLIMSKALRDAGYDALVLRGGEQGDHVFVIDKSSLMKQPIAKAPLKKELKIQPSTTRVISDNADLLRSARKGTGEFLEGEVYEQDLGPQGKRYVIVETAWPAGDVEGFYLPRADEAKMLGEKKGYLIPASFMNPEQELKIPDTTDENIKEAVEFLFFGKPPTRKEAEVSKAPPEAKVTIKSLTKENYEEKLDRFVGESQTQEEYVDKLKSLSDQIETSSPEQLPKLRAWANRQIRNIVGSSGNYKQDYALFQSLKNDTEVGDSLGALEDLTFNIDEKIGKPITPKEKFLVSKVDESLSSIEGEFFLPKSRYTLRGTQNKEWVRTNIPLLRLGNKRGMVGYVFNTLGIQKNNIGSLTDKDVAHLKDITNVEDVFGGSGLLSSLSKKIFPNAKITYNELDSAVVNSIQQSIKSPDEVLKYVKAIKNYYLRNPESDWLSDFVYTHPELKNNKDFMAGANLVDKVAGRVKTDISVDKFRALEEAVPNFSKTFKDVKITTEDGLKKLDYYIKNGTPSDFLWIDPPYIWSSGYGVGSSMEKAEGFKDLLTKIEALNNRGVKFVFFNNEPSSRSSKAGLENVYLDELEGRIARLSKEGMEVVRNISPLSAQNRKEIVVSNLAMGEKFKTLRSVESVKKEIASFLEGAEEPRVFLAEATARTKERVAERLIRQAEKEKRIVKEQEIRSIRKLAKSLGKRLGPGATPVQLANEISRLISKATAEGIDVAMGKEYERSIANTMRSLITNSIRDYMEKQGEPGKKLSKMLLDARHKGDSYAGNAIADIEPVLNKLSDEDIKKFVSVIEDGLTPDTPALKNAVEVWGREKTKVFAIAKRLGLDIKFRSNYFPHFVPEEIIKSARARKDALVKVVQMGKAQTITEAESMYNQVVLRKVARRYGNLEKPRKVDFPIYERDPRKVIPTYLDSAWHRIADAEFLGMADEKAYGLVNQIAVEGGDAKQVLASLDLALGKTVSADAWADLANLVGAIQVITKFTPMTTLANLTQRLQTLIWTGPKGWNPYILKSALGSRATQREKEWATRTGVLLDSSKKQFIQETGGPADIVRRFLRLIRFSPVEDLNRIFTANTARDWAQNYFSDLQRNPADKPARRVFDRIGIDITKSLTNGELSKQDLIDASQYLNDHTQFSYQIEELPYGFKSHPALKLLFQWKSFMFLNSKNSTELGKIVYEETKHKNFAFVIGVLLAAGIGYQIIGEIMNDLYAVISGRKRDKEGFARAFENYLWYGHVFTDTIKATQYGKLGVYSLLAGPSLSMGVDYIYALAELTKDRKTKEGMEEVKSRTAPIGKQVIRDVPIVGPALKGLFFPPEEGKTKGNGGSLKFNKSEFLKDLGGGETFNKSKFLKELSQ